MTNIIAKLKHAFQVFDSFPRDPLAGTLAVIRFYVWFLFLRYILDQFVAHSGSDILLFDTKNDACAQAFFLQGGEHDVSASIEKFCDANTLFVDIGANIGLHSLHALRKGSRVLAFEPNPNTFRLLNINILLNNGAKQTALEQKAVSSHHNLLRLFIDEQQSLLSSTKNALGRKSINVESVVLDTFVDPLLSLHKKIVLKIDVEGDELRVIKGAQKILQSRKVKVVIWESAAQTTMAEREKTRALLTAAGFIHHQFDVNKNSFVPFVDGYNCISIRNQDKTRNKQ